MDGLVERIEYLYDKALPAALAALAGKQETLTQVVQYLEGNYLAPDVDKRTTETEAKKFLLNALTSVASDVEVAAVSVDQLLTVNLAAVESLANQVDLLHNKLQMNREQGALNGFADLRIKFSDMDGLEFREVEALSSYNAKAARPDRVPVSKRLTQLDDIGISLTKPQSSRATSTDPSITNNSSAQSTTGRLGTARSAILS